MKKVFISLVSCLFITFNLFSQAEADPILPKINSANQDEIIEWVDSISTYWMDSVDIPGMVVSIVADDSILMQKGYGYINKEKTTKVDAFSSPFRIASISKTFTAMAALELVSQGKLNLNQDISQYLDFEINRYNGSEITLHHLLTHTAGFDEKLLGGGTKDKTKVPMLREFLATSMPDQIREPGVTFSYSNMGYTLAGYIVEVVSGKPFHEYVDELILDPLLMEHTTFWRGDDPIYSESKSYFRDDNGFREYPPYEILSYPSGSMISTADDLSGFMIMILNEGKYEGRQIISPEVIDLCTKSVFTQDERLGGTRSYGFFNWDINGVRFLTHGGSIEGYRSMLYIFPELKVGMFISTNSSWGSWSNSEIGWSFRKKWLETKDSPIDTALSKGMPENAGDISGSYFTTRSPFKSMMRIGRLTNWTLDVKFNDQGYMYIAGNPEALYAETEPNTYTISNQNRNVAGKIVFKENEKGDVTYMFTSGTNSYFKLKWWETTNVQLIYVLIIFGIFILFLLYNLILIFRKKQKESNAIYKRTYRSSVTATLLHFITFLTIGFYLYISDGLVFDFGLPWFLKVLMVLPLLAIILTLFSLFGLKSVLNEWTISRFKKVLFTINLIALVLILPFMYYWNLLGFNY